MKIAIIGAGAMGSIYAASLAETNETILIDKSADRINYINKTGIVLHTPDGHCTTSNVPAMLNGSINSTFDLVIIFVKSLYTYEAIIQNINIFGNNTTVLTLQNGYGNHNEILKALPHAHILVGTTMHGGTLQKDGSILHAAIGITELGALNKSDEDSALNTISLFNHCGIPSRYSNNIMKTVWRKLIINAGINGIAALLECKNSFIAQNPDAIEISKSIVKEAVTVANHIGCNSIIEDTQKEVIRTAKLTGANYATMLQDIMANRPTEVDFIYGAIADTAVSEGLEAPLCRAIQHLIKAKEALN